MNQDRTSSTSTIPVPDPTILETFPAGSPYGSWPAERFAEARRLEGEPAEVVMHLATDTFLVVVKAGA
ncbi:hypothetical protein [Streptomyces sp. NBC_01483]|uniref:hypothetical protein n=1 Tax=Streptomyces sp. NBC_01483 TaxID=2903883 RepID=UPI002E34F82F|nr:hypothetical protein [Streptomyces sp. NBC_01483]